MRHIERLCSIFTLLLEQVQPPVYVRVDARLSRSQGLLREGMVQDSSLAGMLMDICDVPGALYIDGLGPDTVIVVALFHVSAGSEDGLECGGRVDKYGVRAVSERCSILLLQTVQPDMSILLLRVPPGGDDGQPCPEWPWILGEGVEVQSVDDDGEQVGDRDQARREDQVRVRDLRKEVCDRHCSSEDVGGGGE